MHTPAHVASIDALLRQFAEPLPKLNSPAFGEMFDRYADAQVVVIGEASHGTSDFYRTQVAITQRLIEQHGFIIVAVEADWPDAGHVDRYVRSLVPSVCKRHISGSWNQKTIPFRLVCEASQVGFSHPYPGCGLLAARPAAIDR